MAASNEQTPLLSSEGVPDNGQVEPQDPDEDVSDCSVEATREDAKDTQISYCNDAEVAPDTSSAESCTLQSDKCANKKILGIFVVAFDTKEGNILEWSSPTNLPLEDVEFRALISGAHTITSDFIYFKQNEFYGCASYEKMCVLSEMERGARMKSVGVIVQRHENLAYHLNFLAAQVRQMLTNPGDYKDLQEYYLKNKGEIVTPAQSPLQKNYSYSTIATSNFAQEKSGTQCLLSFFQFFGSQVIQLWRAVLLRRRILFFSPPPIGPVCMRVYCLSLLGSHTTPGLPKHLIKPLFYVNIVDADSLEDEFSYVACTTEKIFEEKLNLWDIYIDNQNVRVPQSLKHQLSISSQDKKRLAALQNLIEDPTTSKADYVEFFKQINNCIFAKLYEVGQSDNPILNHSAILDMGLNPRQDKTFLIDLAKTHGFDVTIESDRNCCCCFS
ncbi:unnamed protein product [Meganyctiphanes norvegica]|uniref:UDENN domain-containing protein n=1 Tax=Meganyctiphanes norvegica TaxID=48144 RepID=A0AAV2PNQ0_MEGNR